MPLSNVRALNYISIVLDGKFISPDQIKIALMLEGSMLDFTAVQRLFDWYSPDGHNYFLKNTFGVPVFFVQIGKFPAPKSGFLGKEVTVYLTQIKSNVIGDESADYIEFKDYVVHKIYSRASNTYDLFITPKWFSNSLNFTDLLVKSETSELSLKSVISFLFSSAELPLTVSFYGDIFEESVGVSFLKPYGKSIYTSLLEVFDNFKIVCFAEDNIKCYAYDKLFSSLENFRQIPYAFKLRSISSEIYDLGKAVEKFSKYVGVNIFVPLYYHDNEFVLMETPPGSSIYKPGRIISTIDIDEEQEDFLILYHIFEIDTVRTITPELQSETKVQRNLLVLKKIR